MSFVNDDLIPLTKSVGLISAELSGAADAYEKWQNAILGEYGMWVTRREITGPPQQLLEELLPLTSPVPMRSVFISTRSKWTAYFNNWVGGTEPIGPMKVLARRLGCDAMRVTLSRQTLPDRPSKEDEGTFGSVIWEVYGPDGKTRRSVYAANDGGSWKFGAKGTPFAFEDTDAYVRKKVRDRFTEEMLKEYLAAMGARPADESWYGQDGVLFSRGGKAPIGLCEHELRR